MSDRVQLTEEGRRIRRETIKLAQANGGYHFGGSFSCVEILLALFEVKTADDVIVFSKGHGCWPLYVMLRERGMNPKLEGHPYRDPANGISWTTGSLGHGMPAAVGMAMARKIRGKPGRIFCVIGDGDVQAGTFWESTLIAGFHGLDNLVVIHDSNRIQGSGYVHDILPVEKEQAAVAIAGWTVRACAGHCVENLKHAISAARPGPFLVTARTVKGAGVSFMEYRTEWHSRGMTPNETAKAMEDLA